MKKTLICALMMSIASGTASAKELTTPEKDAAIAGGVVGGAALVTSPWWGTALYNKNKYGTWTKPDGKLFGNKRINLSEFSNIDELIVAQNNNIDALSKFSGKLKDLQYKHNSLVNHYKIYEIEPSEKIKLTKLKNKINKIKYKIDQLKLNNTILDEKINTLFENNSLSSISETEFFSIVNEDEERSSSEINNLEANKAAIEQDVQNEQSLIKSQELVEEQENASISEINDSQSDSQLLIENEEIVASSNFNLENVAKSNIEENEAVEGSDNYTDKADRDDGEILEDFAE